MQIEFRDDKGNPWYMDQAERFNAFNFNNFNGWECSSGYRSIIILFPMVVLNDPVAAFHPLGNIETGFRLFDGPVKCTTGACVSSADSKISKRKAGTEMPLASRQDFC